ncbi:LysR family transcriptional regulator [Marinivivus vitaminiproducens]|uniref:LysR family transcriptional regulator n=1 Tax=Marinivivus vitaminiproducens TaxID=3035935 RepID=UPI00279AB766|nr:LysR family transcriptional regulator [Geminicoccaceae bacterium SCSIO 64248]
MKSHIESISALRAFVHVAELRSFKLSGQLLGLTPSAVGKAIARLEDQLGVRLFHRSTRSVTLTEAGSLFLERSRHVLAELEAARAELAQATSEARGHLRISLPVAPMLFTPILGAFVEAYPKIELDVDFNDRFVDVIDEGFDAVIRSGEAADSRLRQRVLGSFSWRLVAAPAYLERRGTPASPDDLADHCCLRQRYPETGKIAPWGVDVAGSSGRGDGIPVSLAITMIEPLLRLALAGSGIASLPYFAVREYLNDGRLAEVLSRRERETGVLRLLWPASRYPLPKVRAFIDFVSARIQAEFVETPSTAAGETATRR